MNKSVFSWSTWALLSVYLVILAGAVVRMTGSGMGCPDWPKCFGYFIPPTERSQLDWQPNKNYEKGNVIILDNTLQVATQTFKSGKIIDQVLLKPGDLIYLPRGHFHDALASKN